MLANRIAAAVNAVSFEDLSPSSVTKAKYCLLDFLSSAFVTGELPWGRQAKIAALDARGDCTIVGTTDTTAPGDAAFANAVLGHGLVRDDMHVGSVSHLGVVVIPPAIATAEINGATGREFLRALIAGYEAGGRFGRAILDVDVARIYRPTGICGPVAGAVASAALSGLSTEQLGTAIALAANTALGYNEWAATGGSEMFFHPGFCARNAMTSVRLAAAGAYASPSAIEGPAGILAAFAKSDSMAKALPDWSAPEIDAVFFKEVPACNFAQTSAQAARHIALAHSPADSAIASVSVSVPQAAAAYPGCDAAGPFEHILQAKMSIHYNVASALLRRNFDERNYRPQDNEDVAALARRIQLQTDDALTARYPAQQGATVSVTLKDGTDLRHTLEDVIPAVDEAVLTRFDAAAAEAVGRDRAYALHQAIMALESCADMTDILRLCRPENND